MKQVININFQGRVVPIETTAFEILKNYTDSLNKHFANEEGKEEIINDIESRIGELFQERINKGATCITDDDVNAVIASIGRPEDFEPNEDAQPTGATASSNQQQYSSTNSATGYRKLYRDETHKKLGGVCAGLANYFNIDVVIVRIIFLILLFTFGFGFIPYIILWIVTPSSSAAQIGGAVKKLYRDMDDKIIAGVNSGIGHYFGINPWITRVIFLLPFLSFLSSGNWFGFWNFGHFLSFTSVPTSLIIYVIWWIVVPEANSTSEKLEMKGEKVDMNSIKNSVIEEMKTVGKKAETFGKEAGTIITEKANMVASDVRQFSKNNSGGIGNFIALMAKIFAYFIIGCVAFGLFAALITITVFAGKLFPLKDYLLDGFWQNAFAWGTLLFFLIVPFVGIIIWIIRKLTKSSGNSRILRMTFISLWIVGWFCMIMLVAAIDNDFSHRSKLKEDDISLSNPGVQKMVLTTSTPFLKYRNRYHFSNFDSFEDFLNEDTMYVQNVKIEFVKSPDSNFHVTMIKEARSNSTEKANQLANRIDYNIKQVDSSLIFDKGLAIDKHNKIRNQKVVATVYVPVGKQVRVSDNFGMPFYFNGRVFSIGFDDRDNFSNNDNNNSNWQTGVDYIMKEDGLYTLTGKKADGWNDQKNSRINIKNGTIDVQSGKSRTHIGPDGITVTTDEGTDTYRYDDSERKQDSIENRKQFLRDSIDSRHEKQRDSLEKAQEREKNRIENGIGARPASILLLPGSGLMKYFN